MKNRDLLGARPRDGDAVSRSDGGDCHLVQRMTLVSKDVQCVLGAHPIDGEPCLIVLGKITAAKWMMAVGVVASSRPVTSVGDFSRLATPIGTFLDICQ